ncbi:class I adenylate-forming enzyme family protein [Halorussus halobius]|uniref:class I adenylate-forming enzyme family protein n=1 Tax=Halorussus halobius TaxID=1710537 RepID=UPI001091926C|nr:AMP-binding protein [Halorussus halobius]
MSGFARKTLPPLFEKALRKYADRTAVVARDRRLTYADLDRRSSALATALDELGVDPEDRVAVLLSNRPAYPVVDLAIVKRGAARVPMNPMLAPSEVRHVLADSGARTVVCDAEHADAVATATETLDQSLDVVLVDASERTGRDGTPTVGDATVHRYGRLLAEGNGVDATAPAVDVAPGDVAGHFYTGGTTGEPKGVVYSQAGLSSNLYAHLAELGFDGGDTGLVVTPLSHSAGTFLWANLLAGATIVVHREFDVERTLAAVERRAVTWTFMVPTMIYRLLDHGVESYDCSSLDRIVYGAAPMRPDRLREGIAELGPVFCQFYGQTEVPNLVTTLGRQEHAVAARAADEGDDDRAERLRSAGQPCLLADVRIADPETGEDRPRGEPGEVAVAAPYAFERYHDRPAETDRTLRDGWVFTGDIGRFDEEGYLYLLDRKRDVIVSGGMNVYSQEVADALGTHPEITDVAVFGVPDDDWGEAVHAVVVPESPDALAPEDVAAYADSRLADYKKPKSVEFASELPTTPHGKVDKEQLREPYWRDEDRSVN